MSGAGLEGFATDFRAMKGGKFVAVDSDPAGAALTLSHHFGGDETPGPFRDDLASGAALKWAADPERRKWLKGARHVYNDHFDVDGFLAAWVVLNPDEALALKDDVLKAAAAGDFDEWTGERAVKFAILGEWVDDPKFSQVAKDALRMRVAGRGDAMYRAVLEELPELLAHPERMEELWRRPYDELRGQLDLFATGRAQVAERGRVHLSLVRAPRLLSTRAVVARAAGDRLVQAAEFDGGFMYRFRYRPYLGYRIVSRPTTPAHDLAELAERLNAAWPTPGETWRPRGWWDRELRLDVARVGRRRLAKTDPADALRVFEETFEALDLRAAPPAR